MSGNHNNPRDRLIIFTRYPVPGKTKTRLIHDLGPVNAADLQRRLTEITFRTAHALTSRRRVDLEVRFEDGSEKQMRQWLGPVAIYSNQPQGGLGNRMSVSLVEAIRKGCPRVVLIGSDIPELTRDHLEKAFDALDGHDLVLGPSTDGGYWLVGMKAAHDIFHGVDWGTRAVLEQTLCAAEGKGLNTCLLDPLTDMDTIEDLKQWNHAEANCIPYISVIVPALNEEKNVEKTILSAINKDAEVIVVDGGSSDHTVERALAAGARVLTSDPGRALQQNTGAASASGKVLLFLHADTILPGAYVDHVFEALMDPKTVAGAFRFKTDWESPVMKVVEFLTNLRATHLKVPYGDQGLFIRRSLFAEMGGFPLVPIAEDLRLVLKVARKGRICIVPAHAVTSARRWRRLGVIRTTLINQLVLAGCSLGIPPIRLAFLYGRPKKNESPLSSEKKQKVLLSPERKPRSPLSPERKQKGPLSPCGRGLG